MVKGVRVQNDQIVIEPMDNRADLLYFLMMCPGAESSQGKKGKIGPRVVLYVTFKDKQSAERALRKWASR